jgi:hypothetical protein
MSEGQIKLLRHVGGAAIIPVHYSMDEDKDLVWAYQMKKRGIAEDWEKEMEINFESVVGAACFENYSALANNYSDLTYDEKLPLRLCCDFNVEPMCWEIAQIHPGDVVHFIDEIWISPGDVTMACDEFLDRYGDHYGDLFVYGDASGKSRSSKDQRSNYDEIKLRFSGRPFRLKMRVPVSNPSNVNHVRSLNRRLRDEFGNPKIKINGKKCPNLIKDMTQVVWDPGGSSIYKVRKREDPYFYRTHASDAAMAFIYRHWPTRVEVSRMADDERKANDEREKRKMRNKAKRKRLIGEFPGRGDGYGRR